MSKHNKQYIDQFEKQLRERFEALITTMQGQKWQDPGPCLDEEERAAKPDMRLINASNIRIQVDDLTTILKEIKISLGK
ncbi:hypothetical protein [Iodobacter sp. BJB302]|uniref:hypothetical protein n=1 Tax=Iodobacter sp. BJB302 TaxID=1506510 RepID=UPI00117AFC15|nr:hypothetical protein [Iodobacter sp. BJB302]